MPHLKREAIQWLTTDSGGCSSLKAFSVALAAVRRSRVSRSASANCCRRSSMSAGWSSVMTRR